MQVKWSNLYDNYHELLLDLTLLNYTSMNVMDVARKCQELETRFDNIDSNEKEWRSSTIGTIRNALKELMDYTKINWLINESDSFIEFVLNNNHNESVGIISFKMSHNGLIVVGSTIYGMNVLINSSTKSYKNILTCEPKDLTKKVVYNSISDFLNEVGKEYMEVATFPKKYNADDDITIL